MLSENQVITAYAIFLACYVVFAVGKFPGMKIDRPGMAIVGAVLMVAARIVTPELALRSINFSTIVVPFVLSLTRRYELPPTRYATTLAGNLTITGSIANIIVVERARDAVHIGFWNYFRVGLPVTVSTLLFGWAWLAWTA